MLTNAICMQKSRNLPVHVNFCGIDLEELFSDTDDNRESFVELKPCDIINGQVCSLQCYWESDGRSHGEVDGLDTGIGICYGNDVSDDVHPGKS
jgi:hypothetical protein